ncbi:hypothetical protein O181_118364 [Austropuccinia psidii MF-1]|uniref:Uncharacterized protein n=1 Tax=Austropuccinia psidii MF-1 TaxID=1389203 RepID=A0A9Q3KF61_9BASI|nr:hypothetical protein [Austropuccinia psidii MF-1]
MAECVALLDPTQHLVQAINQLSQLDNQFPKQIYCNNQAKVQISIDNKSRKRMRYLDCAFFFVNNVIQKHNIRGTWINTHNMQADALTKCLSGPSLSSHFHFLGVKWVTSDVLGEGVKI